MPNYKSHRNIFKLKVCLFMTTEVDKPPFRAMFLRRYTLSCVMTSHEPTSGLGLVSGRRGAMLHSVETRSGEKEEEGAALFSSKLFKTNKVKNNI